MITENTYTIKVPIEYKNVEKKKYIIQVGHFFKECNTLDEAKFEETKFNALEALGNWSKIEIGEEEYYFIKNESEFVNFKELWACAYSCYPGLWCPPEKPDQMPILLYHYYWNNSNGLDDNKFKFVDPNELFQWLAKNLH